MHPTSSIGSSGACRLLLAAALAFGLSVAGGCSSVEKELRRLESEDPVRRQESLLKLRTRKNKGHLDAEQLTRFRDGSDQLTGDTSSLVRSTALQVLAWLEAEQGAARAAERLAKDPSLFVRITAARVLGDVGKPETALPVLVAALQRDREAEVRIACVQALEKLGTNDGAMALVDALRDLDSSVRYHASRALAGLTGEDRGQDPRAWRDLELGDGED